MLRPILTILLLLVTCTPDFGGELVNRVQHNGKPMFMIGLYAYPSNKLDKAALEDLAYAGFNCIITPPGTSDEIFEEMGRLGICAIVPVRYDSPFIGDEPTRKAERENIEKTLSRLKNKPALLGWEGPDEPLWNWKYPYQYPNDISLWEHKAEAQEEVLRRLSAIKDGYAYLKSLDPGHQVFLNFAPRSRVEELQWFAGHGAKHGTQPDGRPAADVFGVDIYPVPGGGGNNGPVKGIITPSIAAVGRFAQKQREIAGDAPIYLVLQGCGILEWDPQKRANAQRRPTFEETRFMAFQAVANGANGILWWGTAYIEPDSQLWSDIKRVAGQLRTLAPVLANGEASPVKCSARGVESIRYSWKGHDYVIAVNATDQSLDGVSISWKGLKPGKINALFEQRTVASETGKLIDNFKPYEVHVYSDDSHLPGVGERVKCAFGLPLNSEQLKGKSFSEVAELLRKLGFNAVCAVPEDRELIRELHRAGIKVFAEMSMFCGKRHWESHPESRPINSMGEPIAEPLPGYAGVCPNQEWLRKEILDNVRRKFSEFEYDGLWLDYIRYPGLWERKKPVLEDACYCDVCLARFAQSFKITYPNDLRTNKDKASWILANHREDWMAFKCNTITDFVGQIRATTKRYNPEAILGIFNVPWRREDFGGAVINVLGQDIQALGEYVDVFSPMVYHLMCGFPRKWIGDYTDYVWENTHRDVWPIVQVCDEPIKMTDAEVYQTLRQGIDAFGGSGIMVFTLGHALSDPAKQDALQEAFRTQY